MKITNIPNIIDNYTFFFKEYCRYLIILKEVDLSFGIMFAFFVIGLLTSLNPCSISIAPIYLSYTTKIKSNQKINFNLFFIIGSSLNFLGMGIISIYVGNLYKNLLANFELTNGLIFILIGMSLLNLIPFDQFSTANRRKINIKNGVSLNSFILGFTSSFITSACNIPIIIVLFSLLSTLENHFHSLLLLCCYFIGYSASIFSLSILTSLVDKIVFFNKIIYWITSLFGIILISNGTVLVCNFFTI
nr:dsbD [Porphyropsis coccinea]